MFQPVKEKKKKGPQSVFTITIDNQCNQAIRAHLRRKLDLLGKGGGKFCSHRITGKLGIL